MIEPGTSLIKTENDLMLGIPLYCQSNKFVLNPYQQWYSCVGSEEVQFDCSEILRIFLLSQFTAAHER
jgi:hypothetical protein